MVSSKPLDTFLQDSQSTTSILFPWKDICHEAAYFLFRNDPLYAGVLFYNGKSDGNSPLLQDFPQQLSALASLGEIKNPRFNTRYTPPIQVRQVRPLTFTKPLEIYSPHNFADLKKKIDQHLQENPTPLILLSDPQNILNNGQDLHTYTTRTFYTINLNNLLH